MSCNFQACLIRSRDVTYVESHSLGATMYVNHLTIKSTNTGGCFTVLTVSLKKARKSNIAMVKWFDE